MSEQVSLSEAMDMLTVGEIGFIERHFGGAWGMGHAEGGMTGTQIVSAAIWALERRKPESTFAWPDVEAMTMKDLDNYFAPEPTEIDEADPDSESGKEGSPAAL